MSHIHTQPGPAAWDAFPPQHKEENQAVGSPGKAPRQESEAGDAEGQTPEMQRWTDQERQKPTQGSPGPQADRCPVRARAPQRGGGGLRSGTCTAPRSPGTGAIRVLKRLAAVPAPRHAHRGPVHPHPEKAPQRCPKQRHTHPGPGPSNKSRNPGRTLFCRGRECRGPLSAWSDSCPKLTATLDLPPKKK